MQGIVSIDDNIGKVSALGNGHYLVAYSSDSSYVTLLSFDKNKTERLEAKANSYCSDLHEGVSVLDSDIKFSGKRGESQTIQYQFRCETGSKKMAEQSKVGTSSQTNGAQTQSLANKPTVTVSPGLIIKAQSELKRLGYAIQVDGKWGSASRTALIKAIKNKGEESDGTLTQSAYDTLFVSTD